MKLSRNPFKVLYAIWFAWWFVFLFLLLYPLIRYHLAHPDRYATGHKMRRIWGWIILVLGGIRVKQIEEGHYDPNKSYVITPNHTSELDIISLTVKLKQLDFSFMAKAELAQIPLFNIWFRTIDIAVDRKNARKSAESYMKALKYIDKGRSIMIFPEGTVGKQVPELLRFKDGPFRMAIEKQVDILPVTIMGNHKILPDLSTFGAWPTVVTQIVHSPISTQGMTLEDVPALRDRVFEIIQNTLIQHGYIQRNH